MNGIATYYHSQRNNRTRPHEPLFSIKLHRDSVSHPGSGVKCARTKIGIGKRSLGCGQKYLKAK